MTTTICDDCGTRAECVTVYGRHLCCDCHIDYLMEDDVRRDTATDGWGNYIVMRLHPSPADMARESFNSLPW